MSAFKRDYEAEAIFPCLAPIGAALERMDKYRSEPPPPVRPKPFDAHSSRDKASLVSELCKRDMCWFYEGISERAQPAALLAAFQSEDELELSRVIRKAIYDYCRVEIDKRLEDGRMRS